MVENSKLSAMREIVKSVAEKATKVEDAWEKTASSPRPSPPEEERERISHTRSKEELDRCPLSGVPGRPAWIEIDLKQLKRNFQLIMQDKPAGLQIVSVVKDEGYGHGAVQVAQVALDCGAALLGLVTLDEALALREGNIKAPVLLLGDREEKELPWCLEHNLTCCVSEPHTVKKLGQLAARAGKRVSIHLKVNTGMNRYGIRWDQAGPLLELIGSTKSLVLEGVLSHFSQSDETDKGFALLQLERFREVLRGIEQAGLRVKFRHLCNSGGFLDLPQAHFDMARLGILPLGVYPSSVCRRIPGIEPVMAVKARIAAIQKLEPGDSAFGAGDFAIHIAEGILPSDDVREQLITRNLILIVIVGADANADASDRTGDRHACIHQGETAAANRGH